jgi:transposase
VAVEEQATTSGDVIEELRAEVQRLRRERDKLRGELEALLRRVYGRKTERHLEDDPGPLFAHLEQPEPPPPPHVDEAADDEDTDDEPAGGRKPRKRGAPRVRGDLRRVVEEIEPSPEELQCSCCGGEREVIGYEETEKLEYKPANCYLRVIRRPKLVCKKHEEAGVAIPALPPQVIHKGLAGASMLAQVVTAKYRDHLPLYRQARIYQRQGVELAQSTLVDWIAQAHEILGPITAEICRSVMSSGYVATDDTGITLLSRQAPKQSARAHLWAYLGEQRGDVVFDFTPGRGGEGPKRMLAGYRGFLQADAYSVYDSLFRTGEIVEVGCMAHARRKFFDAKDTAPDQAVGALGAIRALYRVERQCKEAGATPAQRFEARQQDSRGVFDALRNWLAELKADVLPKSPIGKAVGYFCNHADALGRFLENGRLEIDNNRCERAMRQVAVGRKNWLFAGSEAGGRRAATLYSLTVGCWELEIDPFAYLADVLERISSTPNSQIARLTPRGWAQERLGR